MFQYAIAVLLLASMQVAHAMHEMHGNVEQEPAHKHIAMHGMYGRYSWQREASGTSWEPDATAVVKALNTSVSIY